MNCRRRRVQFIFVFTATATSSNMFKRERRLICVRDAIGNDPTEQQPVTSSLDLGISGSLERNFGVIR